MAVMGQMAWKGKAGGRETMTRLLVLAGGTESWSGSHGDVMGSVVGTTWRPYRMRMRTGVPVSTTMRLKFFHSHYQEILDPFSVPGTALRCDIAVYTTKLLP